MYLVLRYKHIMYLARSAYTTQGLSRRIDQIHSLLMNDTCAQADVPKHSASCKVSGSMTKYLST